MPDQICIFARQFDGGSPLLCDFAFLAIQEFDDVFWYCSTPGEDGRNYYIPDDFILDGYARSTREQCIKNGVDWICVN